MATVAMVKVEVVGAVVEVKVEAGAAAAGVAVEVVAVVMVAVAMVKAEAGAAAVVAAVAVVQLSRRFRYRSRYAHKWQAAGRRKVLQATPAYEASAQHFVHVHLCSRPTKHIWELNLSVLGKYE